MFFRELGFKVRMIQGLRKRVSEKSIVVSEDWTWPAVLLNATWHFIDVDFAVSVLDRYVQALDNGKQSLGNAYYNYVIKLS